MIIQIAEAATGAVGKAGIIGFGAVFGLLVSILLVVGLVLLLREIVMWYWKINRIIALLEQIEANTCREDRK
jgi:hypothetical protein